MALRRATGATLDSAGAWIFRRYRFHAGRDRVFTFGRSGYRRLEQALERDGAVAIGDDGPRTLWWTPDGFYWDDEGLDAEAVALIAWDRQRRQDARLDRLRKIRAAEEEVQGARRARIPDDVRAFVWHRDDGRCVRCGSEEDLQFDHVIPVARGGGNAADNVQVLCGRCNREKSDSIV